MYRWNQSGAHGCNKTFHRAHDMANNRKILTREQIRQMFAEDGERWPPFLTTKRLQQMLCFKSEKTVYDWIAKGRLDGAVCKRGKRYMIIRDLAVDILINGPEWRTNGKRRKNTRRRSSDDLPARQEKDLDGRLLVEGQAPSEITENASRATGPAESNTSGQSTATGVKPVQESKGEKVPLKQATNDFLTYQKTEKRRHKTYIKYRGLFRRFVAFAGQQRISSIGNVDLSLIDRFRAARVTEIGDRSMHNDLSMLKTFLGWSTERQLIPRNPLGNTRLRRPKHQPPGAQHWRKWKRCWPSHLRF